MNQAKDELVVPLLDIYTCIYVYGATDCMWFSHYQTEYHSLLQAHVSMAREGTYNH